MSENQSDFVFVSYARQDNEYVQRIFADLQVNSVNVWLDRIDLKAGTRNWEQALRDAISKAYTVILVASPLSRKSVFVQDEIAIARMYERPIIPFWIYGEEWMESVSIGMGLLQHLDAREGNYKAAMKTLVADLSQMQRNSTSIITQIYPVVTVSPTSGFVPRNPYKGLRAFRAEDRDDFFGRDRITAEFMSIIESQTEDRILPIIGPSGSGKSSVVMAGLLPKLQSGGLTGSDRWVYLNPIVPGTHPLENLALALKSVLKSSTFRMIEDDLKEPSSRGLHRLAQQISAENENQRVILYIDQFEELFTLVDDPEMRQQFIQILTTAVTEPKGCLNLILSMRADFYDRPMHYAEFGRLFEHYGRAMLPMTIAELQETIQLPALRPDVSINFEEKLIAQLVFDIRDTIGGLPLLQFALDQLFERREAQTLTMQAYHDLGGVHGALARHAEDTYQSLDSEAKKDLSRSLLLRLIEPGATELDTTRRRANMDELILSNDEQTKQMREVAEVFINARLLTTDHNTHGTSIEVSHEALIREWKRLAGWLDEARHDINLQQEISADVEEWISRTEPDDRLYRGTQLSEAIEWMSRNTPSRNEERFITFGELARKKRVRVNRLLYTNLVAILVLISIILYNAQQFAFRANEANKETIAQAFPLLSNSYFLDGEVPEALGTGLTALAERHSVITSSSAGQIALVNAGSARFEEILSPFTFSFANESIISSYGIRDQTRLVTLSRTITEDCQMNADCRVNLRIWNPLEEQPQTLIEDVTIAENTIYWNWDVSRFYIILAENCDDEETCRYRVQLWSEDGTLVSSVQTITRVYPVWYDSFLFIIDYSCDDETCTSAYHRMQFDGRVVSSRLLEGLDDDYLNAENYLYFTMLRGESCSSYASPENIECELLLYKWSLDNTEEPVLIEQFDGSIVGLNTSFYNRRGGTSALSISDFAQRQAFLLLVDGEIVWRQDFFGDKWLLNDTNVSSAFNESGDSWPIFISSQTCDEESNCTQNTTMYQYNAESVQLDTDLSLGGIVFSEDRQFYYTNLTPFFCTSFDTYVEEECVNLSIDVFKLDGTKLTGHEIMRGEADFSSVMWLPSGQLLHLKTFVNETVATVQMDTIDVGESGTSLSDSIRIPMELPFEQLYNLGVYYSDPSQSLFLLYLTEEQSYFQRYAWFDAKTQTITLLDEFTVLYAIYDQDLLIFSKLDRRCDCTEYQFVQIVDGEMVEIPVESVQIGRIYRDPIHDTEVFARTDSETREVLIWNLESLTLINLDEELPPANASLLFASGGGTYVVSTHPTFRLNLSELNRDYSLTALQFNADQSFLVTVVTTPNAYRYSMVVWDMRSTIPTPIIDKAMIYTNINWLWTAENSIIFADVSAPYRGTHNQLVDIPFDLELLYEMTGQHYADHLRTFDDTIIDD